MEISIVPFTLFIVTHVSRTNITKKYVSSVLAREKREVDGGPGAWPRKIFEGACLFFVNGPSLCAFLTENINYLKMAIERLGSLGNSSLLLFSPQIYCFFKRKLFDVRSFSGDAQQSV